MTRKQVMNLFAWVFFAGGVVTGLLVKPTDPTAGSYFFDAAIFLKLMERK